jgi:hypothetical protein
MDDEKNTLEELFIETLIYASDPINQDQWDIILREIYANTYMNETSLWNTIRQQHPQLEQFMNQIRVMSPQNDPMVNWVHCLRVLYPLVKSVINVAIPQDRLQALYDHDIYYVMQMDREFENKYLSSLEDMIEEYGRKDIETYLNLRVHFKIDTYKHPPFIQPPQITHYPPNTIPPAPPAPPATRSIQGLYEPLFNSTIRYIYHLIDTFQRSLLNIIFISQEIPKKIRKMDINNLHFIQSLIGQMPPVEHVSLFERNFQLVHDSITRLFNAGELPSFDRFVASRSLPPEVISAYNHFVYTHDQGGEEWPLKALIAHYNALRQNLFDRMRRLAERVPMYYPDFLTRRFDSNVLVDESTTPEDVKEFLRLADLYGKSYEKQFTQIFEEAFQERERYFFGTLLPRIILNGFTVSDLIRGHPDINNITEDYAPIRHRRTRAQLEQEFIRAQEKLIQEYLEFVQQLIDTQSYLSFNDFIETFDSLGEHEQWPEEQDLLNFQSVSRVLGEQPALYLIHIHMWIRRNIHIREYVEPLLMDLFRNKRQRRS